jgi:hypothetical protein
LTNFKIIVVENSGYPFDELKEFLSDKFEIISFDESQLSDANYLIGNISKGSSELFAINYSIKNSKIIDSRDFIIKVTGRYYIPNSYLPTTANLKINQTDAQFTSGSPFPDGAYSMQYNVYGGTAGTSGTLSANTWYYVVTTNPASYITVANNGEDVYGTFYNKQSFKTNSAGTTTFTTNIVTGTIAVYPQLGTVTKIFGISYSAYLLVQSVNVKNAQNKCECGKDFTEKIDKLDVLYNSLAFLISPTYASPSAYDSTIQEINLLANEILSCYCS